MVFGYLDVVEAKITGIPTNKYCSRGLWGGKIEIDPQKNSEYYNSLNKDQVLETVFDEYKNYYKSIGLSDKSWE